MKKIFITTVCIALSFSNLITAQTKVKETELSEADKFSDQSGTLIEKQTTPIGKIKGIEVSTLKIKDLNSSKEINAIRFEYEYRSQYTSDTKIGTLDKDEVEGILKSMNNILTTVIGTTRTVYTEIIFTSRGGLRTGVYFTAKKLSSDAPVTKNVKYYIETKETTFEGKSVNKDEKGTYIWRPETTTSTAEVTGKWTGFIKLEKHDSNSWVFLNADEFKALYNLIQEAQSKM